MSRPRLVFMGTAELARIVLASLADDSRWEIVLVVAQPDKPVGRGLQLQAPPVKREALERNLPVLQPLKARDSGFLEEISRLAPDLIVVAAYGQILPASLLAIPRRGCLNVHTSLLPRWRGAAPIQWAMLAGDLETGVTLMHMDAGLDTGGLIASDRTPILPEDTGRTLHDRLAVMGSELLARVLPGWLEGVLAAIPQSAEGVTYARKLTKDDGRLDWSQPAAMLDCRIRALDPWPGAFTRIRGLPGELSESTSLLKIWQGHPVAGVGAPGEILVAGGDELVAAAGDSGQALRILSLQREGRRRMSAREFLAGTPLQVGTRFEFTPGVSTATPA